MRKLTPDRLPAHCQRVIQHALDYGWRWTATEDFIFLRSPIGNQVLQVCERTPLYELKRMDDHIREYGEHNPNAPKILALHEAPPRPTETVELPREEASMSDITSEVIDITPDLALEWLTDPKYKAPNRRIRRTKVATYVDAMRRGEWRITGEAVKFDKSGALIDGQHRLNAIVDSGVSITSLVIRGLDRDAQDVMDTGAARDGKDVLDIHGVRHASVVAAASRILVALENDRFNMGQETAQASNDEILSYALEHPEVAELAGACQLDLRLSPVRGSVALAALAAMSHVDWESAMEFWNRLGHGHQLETGSPILTVRQRLQRMQVGHERHSQYTMVSLLLRTFDAWRKGEQLEKVVLYRNDRPVPIPGHYK